MHFVLCNDFFSRRLSLYRRKICNLRWCNNNAGGTILGSLAPGILWLYAVAALMGIGNGVFHPADFAILNASVTPRRLGHAYSTHGIGGNLDISV